VRGVHTHLDIPVRFDLQSISHCSWKTEKRAVEVGKKDDYIGRGKGGGLSMYGRSGAFTTLERLRWLWAQEKWVMRVCERAMKGRSVVEKKKMKFYREGEGGGGKKAFRKHRTRGLRKC
jgi:hypothetical protein